MKSIRLAIVALFALALAHAALAAERHEDRPVSGFHALSVGVAIDVDVIQDGTESLALEGDADALSKIETSVRNGTLVFSYKGDGHIRGGLHATVHARNMDAIGLTGAGNVRSDALEADALALSISGSGHIEVAGKARTLSARISGSGSIMAPRFEAQVADVSITGAGHATLRAKQRLAAAISGAGTVRYYGDPQIARSVTGVGRVQRVGANP